MIAALEGGRRDRPASATATRSRTPASSRPIARFRAGGYDERIGFTVHDAARFLEPLSDLAGRELGMLADKLVGRHDPERVVALYEAGIEPLRALIAAMHDRALLREVERRRPAAEAGGDP